jgi:hypothetical protein
MKKELKIYLPDKLHFELKKYIENSDLTYSEYVRNLIKKDLKKRKITNVVSLFDSDVYWIFSD